MVGVQPSEGYKATSRREFIFYQYVPRSSCYLFDPPQKDERLSRPWSHLMVLKPGQDSLFFLSFCNDVTFPFVCTDTFCDHFLHEQRHS